MRSPLNAVSVFLIALLPSAVLSFDLQGHRGARGLAPENSLPSFEKALEIGVTTLELDTVVTADEVVIVSHDIRPDPKITRGPDGHWIESGVATFWSTKFSDLQDYDIGKINPASRYANRFPGQVPVDGTPIPSLADVFELTRNAKNETVRFNIETKLSPSLPNDSPSPEAFARALLSVIEDANVTDRVTIQSFDWRTLKAVQQQSPDMETACLTVEQSWFDNIQRDKDGPSPWTAGLDIDNEASVPHLVWRAKCKVWSPFHKDISTQTLSFARALGLQVIPWTVNDGMRMGELIDMGVDGIITDYPDRLRTVMAEKGLPLPTPTEMSQKKAKPSN